MSVITAFALTGDNDKKFDKQNCKKENCEKKNYWKKSDAKSWKYSEEKKSYEAEKKAEKEAWSKWITSLEIQNWLFIPFNS